MKGTTILLLIVSLLGFLPLIVFLIKRKQYKRILKAGKKTNANVHTIKAGIRGRYGPVNETVHYYFTAEDGRQYAGKLVTRLRKHRVNDVLEVYYLPGNPQENTVKGGKGTDFLIFTLAIAVIVIWMMYQLYQTLSS